MCQLKTPCYTLTCDLIALLPLLPLGSSAACSDKTENAEAHIDGHEQRDDQEGDVAREEHGSLFGRDADARRVGGCHSSNGRRENRGETRQGGRDSRSGVSEKQDVDCAAVCYCGCECRTVKARWVIGVPLYNPRMPRRNTGSCHHASIITNVLNQLNDSAFAGPKKPMTPPMSGSL